MKIPVIVLYIYLTNPLDYIDHDVLLEMEAYGIRENANKLFESFLKKQKQITQNSKIIGKNKYEEVFISNLRVMR